MRITIKDIAKKFNVHHSTVSRALRMDARIKPETGEKIRKYAQEHGYQQNLNALKLRGSVRNTIALIIPNINHQYFSNIINFLTDMAYENNYILSIYQSNESFEQECSFIEKILQQDAAGVIASVSGKTKSGEHFDALNRMGIPLVFFDRVLEDTDASRVTVNNREIITSLVSELVRRRRSRIAHIIGPDHVSVFRERNQGYLDGIAKHKIDYSEQIIIKEKFSPEAGFAAAHQLFSGNSQPDAIISTSFFMTMGIVDYANKNNITIPDQLSLAGCGDRLFNTMLHPAIITVEQPEQEMAATAFRLLLNQIKAKDQLDNFQYQNIELKSRIYDGKSSI